MKRFLIIFLICFSSLMGVFAASYGVMLLCGAFDTPVIQPDDLHITLVEGEDGCYLDEGKIFASKEFKIVITASNEDVTQKNLVLSLDSASATTFENKISDGVIRIPATATIGEAFKVELIKVPTEVYPQEELDWIKGGISKIIAKSETNILLQPVSVEVFVDVPVYKMTLSAYSNVENAEESGEFVVDSIFNVKAKFYPEDSMYKFSQKDNLTTAENEAVYKTLYISQHVNEIQYYERLNDIPLKQNLFKSKKVGDVDIVGYVFSYAIDEYTAEKVYLDANQINQTYEEDDIYINIRDLMTANSFAGAYKDTLDLSFVEVAEYDLELSAEKKSFGESTTFQYFANYNSELNSGNFGMQFVSNNESLSLQHEILNTGISVVRKIDETYIPYNNANFSTYANKFYLAYEKSENNSLINPIQYRQLKDSDKVSYKPSVKSTLEGLTADEQAKYLTFYSPKNSVQNVNKSFWELSVQDAGNYEFIVFYNNPDAESELQIELKTVEFDILGAQSDPIHWNDISEKNLIINYDKDGKNQKINDYDLKYVNGFKNINIPQTNKYTTERYFIYSDNLKEGESLSDYIECRSVEIKDYTEHTLYEVDNGIIKFKEGNIRDCKDLKFYALFATLKTNGDGSIRVEDGKYVVDRIVTNDTNEFYQPIAFTVLDSLYNIDGVLNVNKNNSCTVVPDGEEPEKTTLVLKQNISEILSLELSSSQADLLISEYNTGMIELVAKSSSEQNILSDILLINDGEVVENKLTYLLSTKALQDDGIDFNLYIKYLRTGEEFLINECNGEFDGEPQHVDFDLINIYSGKAEFGYFGKPAQGEDEPSLIEILGQYKDSPSTVNVSVQLSNDGAGNTVLETTFVVDDKKVDELFDEEGKILVYFEDKIGKPVEEVDYILESNNKSVLTVQDGKLSFVGVGEATLTLKIGDKVVDTLKFNYAESSAYLNKLTALKELEKPQLEQFEQKEIYKYSENNDYQFDEISVEIIGAKGRKIQFATSGHELITVKYADPSVADTTYDLTENIKYTLISDISKDLKAMVEFTEENGCLTGIVFKEHFAKDVRVRIQASIEAIRFNQIISLVIKSNLSVSIVETFETSEEQQPEYYMDASTGTTYNGVFGKTTVTLNGAISYKIETSDLATVKLMAQEGEVARFTDDIKDEEIIIADSSEFKRVSYQVVVYVVDDMGNEKENEYSYNSSLNYYINPNFKLTLIDNDGIKIKVDGGSYCIDIADALTVERIVGGDKPNKDITINQEIIDSKLVNVNEGKSNILKFEGGKVYLKDNVKTSKTLNLLVNYDGFNVRKGAQFVTIGNEKYYYVTLTVIPAIEPKEDANIVTYDGRKYLALTEGKEYSYTDLAGMFKMVGVDPLICGGLKANDGVAIPWAEPESEKVKINSNINKIIGINNEYYIVIKDSDSEAKNILHYPVIILPFVTPLLADGVEYLKADEDLDKPDEVFDIPDLKNRIDSNYLSANNLYINKEILCGQEIDLTDILKDILVANYTFSVINDYAMDSNTYATIKVDGTDKYLVTNLIGEDKYIILNARKGDSGASQITISFRIKITSNLKVETYYPYDTKGDKGEFVYFNDKQSLQIDFNEVQEGKIPNKASDGKRYAVLVGEKLVDASIPNSKVTFVVESVNLGTTYASASDISKYATFNGSVLTLNNYNGINAFIVNVKIIVGDNIQTANYKIVVSEEIEVYNLIDSEDIVKVDKGTFNSANNSFTVRGKTATISGFQLAKEVGGVQTIVNSEMQFHIYGSKKCSIELSTPADGKVVIENKESLIDEKAYLVVYNYTGKYWIYTYTVESGKTVELVNPYNAGTSPDVVIVVGVNDYSAEIQNVTLEQITTIDGNVIKAKDGQISYLNSNGTISTISYDSSKKQLIISPFSFEAELLMTVEFKYGKDTYTKQFTAKIKPDLTSNYADRGSPLEKTNVEAGKPNESVNISDLFDGDCGAYKLSCEILTDSNLVEGDIDDISDKLTVKFKNSATSGEVLVKVIATYKEDSNYFIESYVKYKVTANLTLTINYPSVNGEAQNSEVVANGTSIDLLGKGLFGDKKRVELSGGDINYIDTTDVQTTNVTYDGGILTLDDDKTEGEAIFKIHYDGDLIGEYHVVVRSTWADVIVPTLKNEDGTVNSADNPEKCMGAKILDIADYKNEDEFFKMLVFGGTYDEETKEYTYGNKSEFYYDVSITNQPALNYSYFKCEQDDKISITGSSNTAVVIKISLNDQEIAKYYVEFTFQVTFNKTLIELEPGDSGTIKELYGITYNDHYTQTVKIDGGKTKLDVYIRNANKDWEKDDDYTNNYKGFITFEQNGTNIEVHGAPNTGVRIDFIVVISCDENTKEETLTCIVTPNYDDEIRGDQPYVIDSSVFNVSSETTLTLATSDPVTSTIVVRRENDSQGDNLIIDKTLWTFDSSDKDSAKLYIDDNQALILWVKKSAFAIKEITITIKDKFDFEFEFSIKIIPEEDSLVKFASQNYSRYELDTFDVTKGAITNSDGKTITNLYMKEIVAVGDGEEFFDNDYDNILKMPAIYDQPKLYQVFATITAGEESTVIKTNLTVKKRYDLVVDDAYNDGTLYLRDGETLNLYDYYNVHDSQEGYEYGERSLVSGQSFHITMTEDNHEKISDKKIFIWQVSKEDNEIFFESEKTTNFDLIDKASNEYKVDFGWTKEDNYAGYKYMLKVWYTDGTSEFLTSWIYSNTIKDNDHKIKFNADTDKTLDKVSYIEVEEDYEISQVTISAGYQVGDTFEYYIPVTNSQFKAIDTETYKYLWSTTIFEEPVGFEGESTDPSYKHIVTDKEFAITSCTGEAKDPYKLTLNFVSGETVNLDVQKGNNRYSLYAKMGEAYNDSLRLLTNDTTYNGLSEDDLRAIKGLTITEDGVEKQTVDIKEENGAVWDYPDSTPLYQTNEFEIKEKKIKFGDKEFDARTITYRALPHIAMLADNTGKLLPSITNYVSVAESASSIDFDNWAKTIYVASDDNVIEVDGKLQTLADYEMPSEFSFKFKLADDESEMSAKVDESTGNITLESDFDLHSNHVSVDVYIVKGDIYEVKVGKVVIVPDVQAIS